MTSKNYTTKNLNIAAFLYTDKRVTLVEIDRANPRSVIFVFEPLDVAEQLVGEYFADRASVNPKELLNRLNDLKDAIFTGGRPNEI